MLTQIQSIDFKRKWQKRQNSLYKSGVDCSYLYVHLESDTGNIFYVGMGKTPGRPWSMKNREYLHKKRVKEHGVIVRIITDSVHNWKIAGWWECWWIAICRMSGFDLVNLTNGGDGVCGFKWTEEQRSYLSKKAKEVQNRPEVIALKKDIRKSFLDSNEGNEWRKKQSEEKKSFSQTEKGKAAAAKHGLKITEYYKTEMGIRQASRQSELAKIQCRGSGNPNSVINETIAQMILDADGSRSEIAHKFNLTYNIVSSIKSRRKWKHLRPTEKKVSG